MAEVTGEDLRNRMVDVYPEGEPCFEPTGVAVQGVDDQPRNRFTSNEDIIISLKIACFKTVPRLIVVLELTDADGYSLLLSDSGDDPAAGNDRVLAPGHYELRCLLPKHSFGERRFYVSVYFGALNMHLTRAKQLLYFDVNCLGYGANFRPGLKETYFRPKLEWQLSALAVRPESAEPSADRPIGTRPK